MIQQVDPFPSDIKQKLATMAGVPHKIYTSKVPLML